MSPDEAAIGVSKNTLATHAVSGSGAVRDVGFYE
ncbi:hypothetical protein [Pseudomonas putida]